MARVDEERKRKQLHTNNTGYGMQRTMHGVVVCIVLIVVVFLFIFVSFVVGVLLL